MAVVNRNELESYIWSVWDAAEKLRIVEGHAAAPWTIKGVREEFLKRSGVPQRVIDALLAGDEPNWIEHVPWKG